MTWEKEFLDWFVAQLEAAVRKLPPPFRREIVQAVRPQGVLTDKAGRPNQAQRVPRPGELHIGSTGHPHPLLGDQQKTYPPITRRRDDALVAPLPAPWMPLPPVMWLCAVTRWTYKGVSRWVPAWPVIVDDLGWAHAPVHVPEANAPAELARVPNYEKLMPLSYLGYRHEMFESTRPRMAEYLPTRPFRSLRHPHMAGIRDGRRFMRTIELPYWWVPETRDEQVHLITSGAHEGRLFWYPRNPDLLDSTQYAVPVRPWLNDPEGTLTGGTAFNTQVENLNVPNTGLPLPVQNGFPRDAWDVPPNYGFMVYMLDRPHIHEDVRDAYHDPVTRFGLSMASQSYRVLEVYEDNGEVVDTGQRVVGRQITGSADRIQRTIADYSGANRKRISYVVESDIGGWWRTATRWEHVVYDPENEYALGATTVATDVTFAMAFLLADDGYPMQGRLDVPYDETVHRPFLQGMRLYEGPYGSLPAPGSLDSGYFCGLFVRDDMSAVEVIRGREHLCCVYVNDDDHVTISRASWEGLQWTTIWQGALTEMLPEAFHFYLNQALPHIHHYRWTLSEWPTQVGQLWLRGVPYWCWEADWYHDRDYLAWQSPPPTSQPKGARCPLIVLPAGRELRLTGAGLPQNSVGDEFPIEWY